LCRLLSGLLAAARPVGARSLCGLLSGLLAAAGPVGGLGRGPVGTFAGTNAGSVAWARAITISSARPIPRALAITRAGAAGIDHLLAVLASEVLARTLAGLNIVLGKFLPDIGVVVFDAVAMVCVMLPLVEIVYVAPI
jgi:hypothetical protein